MFKVWKMIVERVDGKSKWAEDIVHRDPETLEWKKIRINSSATTAKETAEELVQYFNNTLREGETARHVLDVFKAEECYRCEMISKRETWFPEPGIRYQSECFYCHDKITEYED